MDDQINIRKMNIQDKNEVLEMMRLFYASPAVLSNADDKILERDINDCVGDCPFVYGYTFEKDKQIAGYAMTALSYSTEYGGLCIWIEDIYIKPQYQGIGFAKLFFDSLEKEYDGKAVRFRLEAEGENKKALHVYERQGYKVVPYMELSKEIE